jgi:Ca2+-binding RTX toxin-like protein
VATTTFTWSTVVASFLTNDLAQAGDQDEAAIAAIDGGARALAVWTDPVPDPSLQGRVIGSDGTPIGSQLPAVTTTFGAQSDAAIASLKDGNVVVTFTDTSVDAGGDIRGRLFTATGTHIGADFAVAASTSDDSESDIAAMRDGRFVVTWTRDLGGANKDIRALLFNANGTPNSAVLAIETNPFLNTRSAQVAGLVNDRFVVAWVAEASLSGNTSVFFRRFDQGGNALGSAIPIDAAGAINDDIQIVALQDGGFAVAYVEDSWGISGTEITARIFDADGTARTGAILVNAGHTAGSQDKPSLTVLSNGFILVGWNDGGTLRYQAFDPSGVAIGDSFAPAKNVIEAEVAALTAGLVANVRSSTEDDLGGSQSIRSSIQELTRTIAGDATDETLTGDALRDTLSGAGGDDVLDGRAGDDLLDGGAGDDRLFGGFDVDTASYATATAKVTVDLGITTAQATGGAGHDILLAVENLVGSAFNDVLVGSDLANLLRGGAGADRLDGAGGTDRLIGEAGNDTYIVDRISDVVIEAAGQGTDQVLASATYALGAGQAIELLAAADAASTAGIDLFGNELVNTLTGNAGNNALDGGLGADTMKGGAGNDTYLVDSAGDHVIELAGQGIDEIAAELSYVLAGTIENLTLLRDGNLNATGNALANTLRGNAGNNILDGKAGADTMQGREGDDTYVVDNAGDSVAELADDGTDTVKVGFSLVLADNVENLTLIGAASIAGTGNALANTLLGNAAINLLDGREGADVMKGGAGNDTYVVDNAADVVTELVGQGTDTVKAGVAFTLANNIENLTLTGAGSIAGSGNALANILLGTTGNNSLDGKAGADTMKGGAGDDSYAVDNSGDVVVEAAGQGSDAVQAVVSFALANNIENLSLSGTGNIAGTGNSLANEITGNAGANLIDGKLGNDRLSGGVGHDSFLFDSALNAASNVDILLDFVAADDTIRLDKDIFTAFAAAGTLAAAAFHVGTAAADADDRIVYDLATGNLFYDRDGTGLAAAVRFAQVSGSAALSHVDFAVVA